MELALLWLSLLPGFPGQAERLQQLARRWQEEQGPLAHASIWCSRRGHRQLPNSFGNSKACTYATHQSLAHTRHQHGLHLCNTSVAGPHEAPARPAPVQHISRWPTRGTKREGHIAPPYKAVTCWDSKLCGSTGRGPSSKASGATMLRGCHLPCSAG